MVCAFGDIKVLDAKGNYAFPIALSALKRRASLKILLLIKVKSLRQISENFAEPKKTIIFAISIRKDINMKTEELAKLIKKLEMIELITKKELTEKEKESLTIVQALLLKQIDKLKKQK